MYKIPDKTFFSASPNEHFHPHYQVEQNYAQENGQKWLLLNVIFPNGITWFLLCINAAAPLDASPSSEASDGLKANFKCGKAGPTLIFLLCSGEEEKGNFFFMGI